MNTELNFRQEMFAREYIVNSNATSAATLAGYSEKTAYSIGSALLKNVEVKKRIDELKSEVVERNDLNMDEVTFFWREVITDPNEKTSDRIRVSELMAKCLGAFKERVEIEDKTDVPRVRAIDLEERIRRLSLSREDVVGKGVCSGNG